MLILKIAGFVLLGIFVLILLVIGLVLLVPIRYKGIVVKNDSEFYADAIATWFANAVKVQFRYSDKKLKKYLRIFVKKVWKDDLSANSDLENSDEEQTDAEPRYAKLETEEVEEKQSEEKQPEEKQPEEKQSEEKQTEEKQSEEIQPEEKQPEEKQPEEKQSEDVRNEDNTPENKTVRETATEKEKAGKSKEYKKEKKGKKDKKDKKDHKKELTIVDRIKNLWKNRDYLERLWNKEKKDVEKAYKRIVKLLLKLLPKKIKGYAHFGFEDPSTTGKTLGLISALYGMTGALVELQPDFTEQCFDCDVKIKGKIRIIDIAVVFVMVYFNKKLKRGYKALIKLTEAEKKGKNNG